MWALTWIWPNQQPSVQMRCLVTVVTCCPKLSAAGMPGASVPGILRRIFLQNCRMSLQEVSRSFSSTARSAFSWPACRNARSRPTSTAMQSKALWVNCTRTQEVTFNWWRHLCLYNFVLFFSFIKGCTKSLKEVSFKFCFGYWEFINTLHPKDFSGFWGFLASFIYFWLTWFNGNFISRGRNDHI